MSPLRMVRQAVAALLLASGVATAQTPPMAMPPSNTAGSPATAAYKHAMETMMSGMDVPYSGNPDRDFVVGMLPHHQGAIDMAKIELQHGRDPALRRLARDIIASQAKEQAFMRRWLARHPVP